jgi:hypothetical protein
LNRFLTNKIAIVIMADEPPAIEIITVVSLVVTGVVEDTVVAEETVVAVFIVVAAIIVFAVFIVVAFEI